MLRCDNNCGKCGKYSTFSSRGKDADGKFVCEYDCILMNRSVMTKTDSNGNTETIITK